jgi:hypothetical protein
MISSGRSPYRTPLIILLVIVAGMTLGTFLVGIFMDVLTIASHDALAWLGITGVPNLLTIWPGGKILTAIAFGSAITPSSVIIGFFEVLVVCLLRTWIPSPGPGNSKGVAAILLRMLLDTLITWGLALLTGVIFALAFDPELGVFGGVVSGLVQFIMGLGSLAIVVASVFAVISATRAFRLDAAAKFAFGVLSGLAKFALTTAAVTVWVRYQLEAAWPVALLMLASGVMALVDARRRSIL